MCQLSSPQRYTHCCRATLSGAASQALQLGLSASLRSVPPRARCASNDSVKRQSSKRKTFQHGLDSTQDHYSPEATPHRAPPLAACPVRPLPCPTACHIIPQDRVVVAIILAAHSTQAVCWRLAVGCCMALGGSLCPNAQGV